MIQSIKLVNFKCFSSQHLDLGRLTLLSGLNGAGKSSLLQSLLLLRQSHQQGLLSNGRLSLNGDLVQIGTARDALHESAQEETIGFELSWDDSTSASWVFAYDPEADVLAARSAPVQESIFQHELFGDSFQYLCAERIGPRTSLPISDFAVRHHRQIGSRGELTAHFLAVYGSQKVPVEALRHPAVPPLLKDQAESWLGLVSPGTRLQVTRHSGLDLVQLEYSFVSGKDVSSPYRPTNVGFGITYSLPILVAVLAAEPGDLLLVENPEAHLHPRGQVAFGEFLALAAGAGIQLIVETHSDHVLNGIRLAAHRGKVSPEDVRIHFFSWRQDEGEARHEVISPRIDRRGRIDTWPEDFFDQWDKSLEALLLPAEG